MPEPTNVNPVLVDVRRGGIVESSHRGSVVVCRPNGETVLALGQPLRRTFPRSAIKLLQAMPLVMSGAADHWGLTDDELALACASHGGEPMHVAAAESILRKAGLGPSALACGTHPPSHASSWAAMQRAGQSACPLHNNCSGKHAGFLALGAFQHRHQGALVEHLLSGYTHHEHPVMLGVTAALVSATGFDVASTARGIDGCSIPTFAFPLQSLAQAFAKVATGEGLQPQEQKAATRLRQAIARHPLMVAGHERFDSEVMQALGAKVCCKVGAEAVYAAALPEQGLGVAIKMDDGQQARAAEVVMASVIAQLVTLDASERAFIHSKQAPILKNWNGIEVGSLVAAAEWQNDL